MCTTAHCTIELSVQDPGTAYVETWQGPPTSEQLRGPQVYYASQVFGAPQFDSAVRRLRTLLQALLARSIPAAETANLSARVGRQVLFAQSKARNSILCDVFGDAARCDRARLHRAAMSLGKFWRQAVDGHQIYSSVKLTKDVQAIADMGSESDAKASVGNMLALTLDGPIGLNIFSDDDIREGFIPHARQVFLGAEGTSQWWHHDTSPGVFAQLYGDRRWELLPPSSHRDLDLFPAPHPLQRRVAFDSSSHVVVVRDVLHLQKESLEIILHHGEVLVVPPFWFHSVTSFQGPSIGLQQFYDTPETLAVKEVLSSKFLRPAWAMAALGSNALAKHMASCWQSVAGVISGGPVFSQTKRIRSVLELCASRWQHLPLAKGAQCEAVVCSRHACDDKAVLDWALKQLTLALQRARSQAIRELLFCSVHEELTVLLLGAQGIGVLQSQLAALLAASPPCCVGA